MVQSSIASERGGLIVHGRHVLKTFLLDSGVTAQYELFLIAPFRNNPNSKSYLRLTYCLRVVFLYVKTCSQRLRTTV